jgi:hypothetical protein
MCVKLYLEGTRMDKSFLVFIGVGLGFLYLVTRFVGDIQKEDALQNDAYKAQHKYEHVYETDSVLGERIINVSTLKPKDQIEAWNQSDLRYKMLEYFPNFEEMKAYVEIHVKGEPLRTEVLHHIEKTADAYLAGEISSDEARTRLLKL